MSRVLLGRPGSHPLLPLRRRLIIQHTIHGDSLAMSTFTVPQSVGQNIARAKSLLKRDEIIRALEALMTGLDLYEPSKLMGKARFETEVLIQESVTELNRQPMVRNLFESVAKSNKAFVPYVPGQERKLKDTLVIIHKALAETIAAKEQGEKEKKEARKTALQEKGLTYLREGDAPRGKAALRVLADEFGHEPGVYTQVGIWLQEAKLYFEAAEFLEQAIEHFPKESAAYGAATACYLQVREFEKAEAVYLKAIRQFGKHPRTLVNLAKMYIDWNKKEKAFETAQEALNADPGNAEAKAIVDRFA